MRIRKKILVITSSFDMTVDYMISKYCDYVDFYRLNTDYFSDYRIEYNNSGFYIENDYWSLKEKEIYSIYYRKPSLPNISEYDQKYHKLMYKEILTVIEGIIEVFNGKCLTKPTTLKRAENKIYQLRLAQEVGFIVPASLITNSNYAAQSFCEVKECIVKPISIGRMTYEDKVGVIQTNLVNTQTKINNLSLSPVYFQEYYQKDYEVRLTIINNRFYGVKIETNEKVDWRKHNSKNKYEIIDVPNEIRDKCKLLMRKLKLNFGAFDFIVNNDKYVYLEINPNGQWLWLEEELSLDISNSIIKFLTGEKI